MSDERMDVTLKEAAKKPSERVWRRFWGWLKQNFPFVTRSGADFTSAKVAQEQGKAKLIEAQARLESAKAAEIEAKTRVLLSELDAKNEAWCAARRQDELIHDLLVQQAQTEVLGRLEELLRRADRMGVQISIEEVPRREPGRLLAAPEEDAQNQ
ncbi:MAG TPA: hypothetical protein VEY93_07715 [Longimicrobium sp.]|nr:hypothetical protein [Longimicrobium sp.]